MSPEEAAKIILTLRTTGDFIDHPHNRPFRSSEEQSFGPDRFANPSAHQEEDEASTPAPSPVTDACLRFTIDSPIKDFRSGFVFGSDRATCDVYVDGYQPLSRRLFALQLGSYGVILLKNFSTFGVNIKSRMLSKINVLTQRAILPDDTVTIKFSDFTIQIDVPDHSTHPHLYQRLWQPIYDRLGMESTLPGIQRLELDPIPISSARSFESPYLLLEELDCGAQGSVHRAVHCKTGTQVAVKQSHRQSAHTLKEAAILQSLSHVRGTRRHAYSLLVLIFSFLLCFQPNIVEFIDFISQGNGTSLLVMEFVQGLSLEAAHRRVPMALYETRELIIELLSALAYLHHHHVTHRDLKPANILVTARRPMQIKVADFGVASQRSSHLNTLCGSNPYLAPEIRSASSYTSKADIWSVGVIALELVVGLPRYPQSHGDWPGLLRDRIRTVPAVCYHLINSLLQAETDRPSAQEALADPFLLVCPSFLDGALPGRPDQLQASSMDSSMTSTECASMSAPTVVATTSTTAVRVELGSEFWTLQLGDAQVTYLPGSGWINMTHVLARVYGRSRGQLSTAISQLKDVPKEVWCRGRPKRAHGTYVGVDAARRIVEHLQLDRGAIHSLIQAIRENGGKV